MRMRTPAGRRWWEWEGDGVGVVGGGREEEGGLGGGRLGVGKEEVEEPEVESCGEVGGELFLAVNVVVREDVRVGEEEKEAVRLVRKVLRRTHEGEGVR